MKKILFALLFIVVGYTSFSQQKENRYFELRTYYCYEGKLDALIQRFSQHTLKFFEKYGMTNIGYWVPENNTQNTLYYILAYPSKKARDESWAAFAADPDWQKAKAASEENGKIVERIESVMLNPLQFSPIK